METKILQCKVRKDFYKFKTINMEKLDIYRDCWYCDNIVTNPDAIGLLYLGTPRCFVVAPSKREFYFGDYESFEQSAVVEWLDGGNVSANDQERVLTLLWNFSVRQEQMEEEMAEEWDEEFL